MVKKHKSATNLTINFLSGEKILIQLAKESTMFVKKFLIYLKRNGGKLLIAQMIFADDGIKLNSIIL
ncbi:unnamed protein product [Meloidogyne enterolobii]|uniref:Uncharacterized protein n=1 Tax=Meloidogyne enterolobii TaxID=390850 RepID=A0ACB0YPY9_MELEN